MNQVKFPINMKTDVLQFSHKEFLNIDQNYERAATAVDLVYVKDNIEGIERIKKGKGFSYQYESKVVTDKKNLERIQKLVIPPAWRNVWISPLPNGHIQATGIDARNRKQYRYHASWNSLRKVTKYHHLYEFGKALPLLRKKLEADMSIKELTEEKVLATVISLMEHTYIRIGNEGYEKMYGSYGLTTLKDKHVKINGASVDFSFKGKKGVYHKITLKNKRLAKIVKECRDIPGKELFQYYDPDGTRKSIDSGKVNQYIKSVTSNEFTAKDFRLWAGSLNILRAFKMLNPPATKKECKQNIITALEDVSRKLGNTKSVCRNYYVHPGIITLYEESNLDKYLRQIKGEKEVIQQSDCLNCEEEVLMRLLKDLN